VYTALAAAVLFVAGSAQAATVTVDGDLSDIIAAQGGQNSAQASDPFGSGNGSDISNIYYYYDAVGDTMYFGIASWGQIGDTGLLDFTPGAFDFLENARVLVDLNSDGNIDYEYSIQGDGVADSGANTETGTIVTNVSGLPGANFSHAVSEANNGIEFSITGAGFLGDLTIYLGAGDSNGSAEDLVSVSTTIVPVPAAAWLFGSGLLALAGFGRSRNAIR